MEVKKQSARKKKTMKFAMNKNAASIPPARSVIQLNKVELVSRNRIMITFQLRANAEVEVVLKDADDVQSRLVLLESRKLNQGEHYISLQSIRFEECEDYRLEIKATHEYIQYFLGVKLQMENYIGNFL